MAGINEAQLATWAKPGASVSAEATFKSVQAALSQAQNLKQYGFEVYLQGSYGNGTNIYGNSDVDVVAELTSAHYADITLMSGDQQQMYNRQRTDSSFTFAGFRDDVQKALAAYYGGKLVTARDKCIEVAADSGRQDADVVPCLEHRLYKKFFTHDQKYDSGIKFFTRKDNIEIVNYPKLHMTNGTAKNTRAGNYKPAIRLFKNWRDRLVAEKLLAADVAPSYFIECLAWNIPDETFNGAKWNPVVLACLNVLHGATLEKFMCQNNVIPLFGEGRVQWNVAAAKTFRTAIIEDWNRGR